MLSVKLIVVFLLFLFLKIILTVYFPLLGDEAYYVFWGTHLAGGYYDLPPMIGWWESFFTRVSGMGLHPLWFRLPNFLVSLLVSFAIFDVLKWVKVSVTRARLIAFLYFFMPVQFLVPMISPDVPLIFFTFFGAMLFYWTDSFASEVKTKFAGYFFSGALLGAAFLSKYFVVFMAPALIVWFLISRENTRDRFRSMPALAVMLLGVLPFVFQHLWWNSQHCWANFVFNLVSRQTASDGSRIEVVGLFMVYLLILATPVFWFDLFKKRNEPAQSFEKFCFLLWAVPISIFGFTALMGKGQGLHWYVSYLPFFVIWVGLKLDEAVLRKRARAMMMMTGLLGILVCFVVMNTSFVIDRVLHGRFNFDVQMSVRGQAWVKQVEPMVRQAQAVVSDGYNFASVVDYQLRRHLQLPQKFETGLWGSGSRFGRVFDSSIHFSRLNEKNIFLLSGAKPSYEQFAKYFLTIQTEEFEIEGAHFVATLGFGFKARDYINEVLKPAFTQFYPNWLLPSVCSLKDELL